MEPFKKLCVSAAQVEKNQSFFDKSVARINISPGDRDTDLSGWSDALSRPIEDLVKLEMSKNCERWFTDTKMYCWSDFC